MSKTKRNELIVASALLTLVAYTFSLSALGAVETNRTLSNRGTVMTIGVGVYTTRYCTTPLSSIDWGVLEPGSNKNFTCYIRNEGNSPSTLSMYTSNWNPSNAENYMTLSWNYGGQSLNVNAVVEVTFTLSVSASIDGIASFSFDITIVGGS